jgi:hypothetical protein
MGNFFESIRLTGVGWVFAFFIVGATILAGRWLVGLGVAKYHRELAREPDASAASAGVAAPVPQQEAKTLFDRADELLKQGTQSEDNRALIEATIPIAAASVSLRARRAHTSGPWRTPILPLRSKRSVSGRTGRRGLRRPSKFTATP